MRKRLIMGTSAAFLAAAPAIVHMSAYEYNANTLTRLFPDLYAALNVVSRELVGFIPSVNRAPGVERVAFGASIVYPIAPTMAAYDIAPAMQVPTPPDTNVGNGVMQLTKQRGVAFGMVGDDQLKLNSGPGYLTVQAQMFAQALRTLVNEIERDVSAEAAANASRAYGSPGTTPFASGVGDTAQLRKILDDNGAPLSGRSLIVDTAAAANLRTNTQLTKANEAGTNMTLRQGELLDINGFSIKDTSQAVQFVKGTNNGSASTNNAGYAVGATTITLASAGTGTIKAGDVITFAGDTNKYVVASGDADVSNGGTIELSAPGLRVAIPASNTVITTGNSYTANVGFSADALHLAIRPPAKPLEGDLRLDDFVLVDPRSGIGFEVSIWPGHRMIRGEVSAVWGVKAVKREHIALLLG